jgi:hypothetical protein
MLGKSKRDDIKILIKANVLRSLMALPKVSKNKNLAKPLYRPAHWAGRVSTTKVLVAHGAKNLERKKLRVSVDGGYLVQMHLRQHFGLLAVPSYFIKKRISY